MRTTTSRTLLALTLAAGLVITGCGDDSDDADRPASTSTTEAAASPDASPDAAADSEAETVRKTIEVSVDGAVDDPADRLFAVTYFYSPDLDAAGLADGLASMYDPEGTGEPPEGLVMGIAGMCGPAGWTDAVIEATGFSVDPGTGQACTDDAAPFRATLDLPPGTALHYSVDTGLLSDLENIDSFAGNHEGDPMDPPTAEDVEIVDADDVTSYTYEVSTEG